MKRQNPLLPLKGLSTKELFEHLAETTDHRQKEAIKQELIERYSRLVVGLAKRFKGKGEPFSDLVQVGHLGLVLAIERYDHTRDADFVSFATPTILGEIKRYFRDRGWALRVPRKLQELNLKIHRVLPELTQILDRKPTTQDLAEYLGVEKEEVIQALEVGSYYFSLSLDAEYETKEGQKPTALKNISGEEDQDLESISWKTALQEALRKLPKNDREILQFRFFENLTQAEIASRMKVSQMQISRLQKVALSRLRKMLKDL